MRSTCIAANVLFALAALLYVVGLPLFGFALLLAFAAVVIGWLHAEHLRERQQAARVARMCVRLERAREVSAILS